MALAINIRADNASANEIEQLWDQVAVFEDEPRGRADERAEERAGAAEQRHDHDLSGRRPEERFDRDDP